MENAVFFNYFLKSLRFYFDDRFKDIKFIKFFKDEQNSFIVIEDYILEVLVILSNILNKEGVKFFCGVIHDEGVVTGVEVCMDLLELERLNNLYNI